MSHDGHVVAAVTSLELCTYVHIHTYVKVHGSNEETKDNMSSNRDSSWSQFNLTPVLHTYSYHTTSYMKAAGAVFKAYNGLCQLTIE